MHLYKIQFSKALKMHLDALLNQCSLVSPAAGTQALGFTSHFQLPLLAFLWEELLLTARKAPHLPAFSRCEFICEAASGVEGICSYYWQPVTAVMCCMLTACLAPQSVWDGRCASAKEPAICARAGRSRGAPCQQHCPKASRQRSRQNPALVLLWALLNCAWSLCLALGAGYTKEAMQDLSSAHAGQG